MSVSYTHLDVYKRQHTHTRTCTCTYIHACTHALIHERVKEACRQRMRVRIYVHFRRAWATMLFDLDFIWSNTEGCIKPRRSRFVPLIPTKWIRLLPDIQGCSCFVCDTEYTFIHLSLFAQSLHLTKFLISTESPEDSFLMLCVHKMCRKSTRYTLFTINIRKVIFVPFFLAGLATL